MSDIAPFVAAALRDKVVKELHEENAKLRKQMADDRAKEARELAIHVALNGFDNDVYRTVIVDSVDHNIVYAVAQTGDFESIKDCTLGDLSNAEIFVNGESWGPFREQGIRFQLYVDSDSIKDSHIDSQGLDAGGPTFGIIGTAPTPDYCMLTIYFDLSGVSNRQLLEFAGIDPVEYFSDPYPFEIGFSDRNKSWSLEEVANHFGHSIRVDFNCIEETCS